MTAGLGWRRAVVIGGVLAAVLPVAGARAEEGKAATLRFATAAPDGTAWAREIKAFGRDVETGTNGSVHVRTYFGGIAGDELQMLERVRRSQLDGIMSGGMVCTRLSPSMRVLRIPGLFQSWDEVEHVSAKMKPIIDAELEKAGFINLGEMNIGPSIVFSRAPVTSLAELQRLRLWSWDLDEAKNVVLRGMGFAVMPLSLSDAGRAYDQGRIDGFGAILSAALAFQWSAQSHYMVFLPMDFLVGCLAVSRRSFDALPIDAQRSFRAVAAKYTARIEVVGHEQDDALRGGLLARQGVKPIPLSDEFRGQYFAAALKARDQLGESLVPRALLNRVVGWLADYRAQRPSVGRTP